jgi:hypothetical protein
MSAKKQRNKPGKMKELEMQLRANLDKENEDSA